MLFFAVVSSLLFASAFTVTFCPTNYDIELSGMCYFKSADQLSFGAAVGQCSNNGGSLTLFDDAVKKDAIDGLYSGTQYSIWTGIKYDGGANVWKDHKMNEQTYLPWRHTYPNVLHDSQCGFMVAGEWENAMCAATLDFVCEAEMITKTCEDRWIELDDVPQCVKPIKRRRDTFKGAIDACKALDPTAHLATAVKSRLHRNAIAKRIGFRSHFWIGVYDQDADGTMEYLNGDLLGDNPPFRKGLPINVQARGCGSMRMRRWYNKRCDRRQFYICQKPLDLTTT